MISSIVSRLVILVFGTLYPAYASYKAVRTKNVKEYVKWMMYWIVFALFTCAETFTDVFLSFWFPFYYEIKIILVLWLLSPATKGSSILYRKFVHPMLSRREQDIDEYIAKAKEQGYHTVLHLGTKGVNYATTVIMQTAIKGGGGLVQQLRRSYSLSDLSSDKDMADVNRNSKALSNIPDDEMEETDGITDPRLLRPRGYSPRRSASGSGRVEMYFPEVDVDVRQHGSRAREPSIPLSHIRSSEDVSSGYSSAEPLYASHHQTKAESLAASREPLVRTASVGSTRSMRTKSARGGLVAKRPPTAEDSEPWSADEAEFQSEEEYLSNDPSLPVPITQPELLLLLQQLNNRNSNNESFHESASSDLKTTQPILLRDNSEDVVDDSEFLDVVESFVEANVPQESAECDIPSTVVECTSGLEAQEKSQSFVPTETISVKETSEGTDKEVLPNLSTECNQPTPVIECTEPSCPTEERISIQLPTDVSPFQESSSVNHSIPLKENDPNLTEEDCSSSCKSNESLDEKNEAQPCTSHDSDGKEKHVKCVSTSEGSSDMPSTSDTTILSVNDSIFTDKLDSHLLSLDDECTLNDIETTEMLEDISSFSDETIVSVDNSSLNDESDTLMLSEQPPSIGLDSSETFQTSSLDEATADSPLSQETAESLISDKVQDLNSDKKDSRSGRYHKRPAPSPPGKTSDADFGKDFTEDEKVIKPISNLDSSSVTCITDDVLVKESIDQEASGQTHTAVKARLVLKPGVVRNLGPEMGQDMHNKSEKFVSSSTKSKAKNKSRAPGKYRESSFSRLFMMPKNQLGNFASLFPFWHGRGDSSSSSRGMTNEESSVSIQSSAPLASAEVDFAAPSSLRTRMSPMSCSLDYLPGSYPDELSSKSTETPSEGGNMCREKSNSISDFKMRDLSHSPPANRHQLPESKQ